MGYFISVISLLIMRNCFLSIVPPTIIQKPVPLTALERERVKVHSTAKYRLIFVIEMPVHFVGAVSYEPIKMTTRIKERRRSASL